MLYLKKYLNKLRESSVVNMLAASPYLYMGKERLAHEHKYNDTNEAFDELLDMANKAQGEMVNGVISMIEDENKEVTVERINAYLRRYSPKIISFYSNYF
jgi:chromosome condensin MukBEF MukE localization factor